MPPATGPPVYVLPGLLGRVIEVDDASKREQADPGPEQLDRGAERHLRLR